MGLFAIYFKGSHVEIYFQVCSYVLQSLKIVFMIANSAGPDEMVNFVAFHLGLHCCQNNPVLGLPVYKGLIVFMGHTKF